MAGLDEFILIGTVSPFGFLLCLSYETSLKTHLKQTKNKRIMVEIIVPIFVCVIMPVAIVLITSLSRINGDKQKTQIIIKAIEANPDIDAEKLLESLKKPQKTTPEIRNRRLLCGCTFTLSVLFMAIVCIVSHACGIKLSEDPITVPLILGSIALAIGISYLIVYFVSRKQTDSPEEK